MRRTATLLVLSFTCLVACGGAPARTAPPPDAVTGSRTLLDVVPEASRRFTYMNFAAVRGTRLYGAMDETLGAWADSLDRLSQVEDTPSLADAMFARPGLGEEAEEEPEEDDDEEPGPQLWELMARSDWVFVASEPNEESPRGVSLFGARFTPEEAQTLVTTAAGDRSDLPMDEMPLPFGMGAEPPSDPLDLGVAEEGPIEASPVRVYGRDGYEALEFRVVEVVPGVWVLGVADDVATVLERWDNGDRRPRDTPQMRDRARLFEHHVGFVVEDAAELQRLFAPQPPEPDLGLDEMAERLQAMGDEEVEPEAEEPEPPSIPDWLEDVTAAALTVDFDSGLRFRGLLETPSAEEARRTHRALSRELTRAASSSRFVALFGMRAMVERVEAERDGDHVRLGVELDELESHGLWGRLSGSLSGVLVAAEGITGVLEDVQGDAPLVDVPEALIEGAQLESTLEVDGSADATQTGAGVAGGQTDASSLSRTCSGRIGNSFHLLRVVERQDVRVLLRAREPLVVAIALDGGGWRCSTLREGAGVALDGRLAPGLHRLYVGTETGEPTAYVVAVTQDDALSADALPLP
ncbi:MAG: hypothetical protein AB8I08_04175 [Sandaracinaceae bacterium]